MRSTEPEEIPMPVSVSRWLLSQSVSALSTAAEGGYLRLLMFQWRDGGLPESVSKLAGLCRTPAVHFKEVWAELEDFFPVDEPGIRRNPMLEEMRDDMDREKRKVSERARQSVRKRWAKDTENDEKYTRVSIIPKNSSVSENDTLVNAVLTSVSENDTIERKNDTTEIRAYPYIEEEELVEDLTLITGRLEGMSSRAVFSEAFTVLKRTAPTPTSRIAKGDVLREIGREEGLRSMLDEFGPEECVRIWQQARRSFSFKGWGWPAVWRNRSNLVQQIKDAAAVRSGENPLARSAQDRMDRVFGSETITS